MNRKENTPKMEAFVLLSTLPDDADWDRILALVLRCQAYQAHRVAKGRVPLRKPSPPQPV